MKDNETALLPRRITFDGEKFTDEYTFDAWVGKIRKDVTRIGNPKADDHTRLVDRLADVITDCASWLNQMGFKEESRLAKLFRDADERHDKLGYFKTRENDNV